MASCIRYVPSCLPPEYGIYLDVYGNQVDFASRTIYFLAVRFKSPVSVVRNLDNFILEENSIVLFDTDISHLNLQNTNALTFIHEIHKTGSSTFPIPVKIISKPAMLWKFIDFEYVLHWTFSHETVFLISVSNPFAMFWKRNKKNDSFKALCELTKRLISKETIKVTDVSLFRHFEYKWINFGNFSSWLPLAQSIFRQITEGRDEVIVPTSLLGKEVQKILQRSKQIIPDSLPPAEFYECEFLLENSALGILCNFDNRNKLQYISPMVVSKCPLPVSDTCGIQCNMWFPLYWNAEKWDEYGCMFYIVNLSLKKHYLRQILSELLLKGNEKHQMIYRDFVNVCKMILGDEANVYI